MREPHSAPNGAYGHQAGNHLGDFDSHKVGALWEEVVGSASCVPCPGKIQIIPNREILRCEGSTSSHWSACARAGEVVAGGADIVHGWIGQSMWLPHLLWSFFIFIPSVLGFRCDQDESVSLSNKEMGPAAFISTRLFIVQT